MKLFVDLVMILLLFACTPSASPTPVPSSSPSASPSPSARPSTSPTPVPSESATPSPSPEPSVTPSDSPLPSPSPSQALSQYESCRFASQSAASWIRQSVVAMGSSGFERLGCPVAAEVVPFPDDGRFTYQAFEKSGLCVAWDWSKPKNYVFTNYVIQACSGVPNFPGVSVAKPKFPIGVWFQPSSSMAKWKGRGINTMLGFENESGSIPFSAWSRDLQFNNLFAIRQPQGDPKVDAVDPRLLAWFVMNDEPDLNPTTAGKTPADAQAKHDLLKAAAPFVPLYINFSGGNVRGAFQGSAKNTPDQYKAYMAAADWVSNDLYPITGWNRPDWVDMSLPIAVSKEAPNRFTVGWTQDQLNAWSPGKLQMAVLECSDQQLSWVPNHRAPTPDEMRAEIWDAIIHGAKAIGFFPDCIGNGWCGFDGMTDVLAAEMTKQNAVINANGDWLSQPSAPLVMPAPFEAAKFSTHTVILNLSSKLQTLNVSEVFGPYEVKIK